MLLHPGSRLEGLLEKSHVSALFAPGAAAKRRRTHLDAALQVEVEIADGATSPSSAAVEAPPEESPLTMATQITSYNPCKNDPYGASSMPIYQVSTFAQPSATTFGGSFSTQRCML